MSNRILQLRLNETQQTVNTYENIDNGKTEVFSVEKKKKIENVLLTLSIIGLSAMFIYVIFIWEHLPDTIPRHFNFKGEPDGFGGKGFILVLPFTGLGIFVLTTLLSRIPDAFYYQYNATKEQKKLLYNQGRIYIRLLQAEIVYFFLFGVWRTAQVALGKADGLGVFPLYIFLIVILGTSIYFAFRTNKVLKETR